MPNFTFTARDGSGQWHNGTLAAESAASLAGTIRARGWSLVKAEESRESAEGGAAPKKKLRRRGILPATNFDVQIGLRMIAAMLGGGVTLMSALKTSADQARRPAMAAVWDDIHDNVAGGMSFHEALSRHSGLVPKLVIQLAKAGEMSGNLELVLEQAADQMERKRNLMVTVVSAMMYPAFTAFVACGVGAYLVIKIIPEISQFLTASGKKLPAVTQALISFSQAFNANIIPILIALCSFVVAIVLLYQYPRTAGILDRLLLQFPVVGKILKLSGTTLFSRSLAMLLEAGVPMIGALETSGNMMKNRAIIARVEAARRSVLAGNSLHKPLAGGELMPMLPRMVAVGEETGTLSGVLIKVAEFHEKQLESYVKRMTLMIEPVMTVVVGSMVGFVYLAFFMAIYSF